MPLLPLPLDGVRLPWRRTVREQGACPAVRCGHRPGVVYRLAAPAGTSARRTFGRGAGSGERVSSPRAPPRKFEIVSRADNWLPRLR